MQPNQSNNSCIRWPVKWSMCAEWYIDENRKDTLPEDSIAFIHNHNYIYKYIYNYIECTKLNNELMKWGEKLLVQLTNKLIFNK